MKSGWRKDVKWICSILLVNVIIPLVILRGFYAITAPEPAREIIKGAVLTGGLSGAIDNQFEALKQSAVVNPAAIEAAAAGFGIAITAADILNNDVNTFKDKVAAELASQVYDGRVARNPFIQNSPLAGVLQMLASVLSESAHNTIGAAVSVLTILAIFLAVPVLLSSFRFGKAVTLGVVLILGSVPGSLLFTILGFAASGQAPQGGGPALPPIAAEAVLSGRTAAFQVMGVGLILLFIGIIGGIAIRVMKRGNEGDRASSDPDEAAL